jgi:hypothetical protein
MHRVTAVCANLSQVIHTEYYTQYLKVYCLTYALEIAAYNIVLLPMRR